MNPDDRDFADEWNDSDSEAPPCISDSSDDDRGPAVNDGDYADEWEESSDEDDDVDINRFEELLASRPRPGMDNWEQFAEIFGDPIGEQSAEDDADDEDEAPGPTREPESEPEARLVAAAEAEPPLAERSFTTRRNVYIRSLRELSRQAVAVHASVETAEDVVNEPLGEEALQEPAQEGDQVDNAGFFGEQPEGDGLQPGQAIPRAGNESSDPGVVSRLSDEGRVANVPDDPEPVVYGPPRPGDPRHGDDTEIAKNAREVADLDARMLDLVSSVGDACITDEQCEVISQELVDEPNVILNTRASSNCTRLKVDRKKYMRTGTLMAAVAMLLYHWAMRQGLISLCTQVLASGGRLVELSYHVMTDETPMKVAIIDSEEWWDLPDKWTSKDREHYDRLLKKASADSGTEKLLQTLAVVTALVFVGGRWWLFTWRPPLPYMALSSRSASSLYTAQLMLENLLGLREITSRFAWERIDRGSTTDHDGALGRAERAAGVLRGRGILRALCTIHKLCTVRHDVMNLVPEVFTRVKHVCLLLKEPGTMRKLRKAMAHVVDKKISIIRTRAPSPQDMAANERDLRRVMPDSVPGNAIKRWVILGALPGNWKNRKNIEVFPPDHVSDQTVFKRIIRDVMTALVGCGPGNHPGRNFIKAEFAARWIAALDLVHGLFPMIMEALLLMLKSPKAKSKAKSKAKAKAKAAARRRRDVDSADEGDDESDTAVVPAVQKADCKDEEAEKKREEELEGYKSTLEKWLEAGTVCEDTVPYAEILNTHATWMSQHMHCAGDGWEREQRYKEARRIQKIQEHLTCPELPQGRTYRVLVAYRGEYEQSFINETYKKMNGSEYWSGVPAHARTEELQTTLTIQLARGAAGATLVQHQNRRYPYKLICSVFDDALAEDIEEEFAKCKHIFDQWSLDICNTYMREPGGIRGETPRKILLAKARTLKVENLLVEKP